MPKLPFPLQEAILYENERLYICLASFPITKGHTIVVWKNHVPDLHSLSRSDYEYLMDTVEVVRNVLLEVLKLEKVYLLYMDEISDVHWHLIPRFDEKGFNIFLHQPKEIKEFPLAPLLKEALAARLKLSVLV